MNESIVNVAPQLIPIWNLQDHPQNPRIALREDVVDAIVAGLADGFDPAHALIVRPYGNEYQVLSGHHRKAAAARVGIDAVPCWVRELDDDAAYMALVTSNSQGELSPLEIGLHALNCVALGEGGRGKKGGLSEYAELIGKDQGNVSRLVQAARVAGKVCTDTCLLQDKTQHLAAIHALPADCWQTSVELMLEHGWSVKDTQAAVERIKTVQAARPAWLKTPTPLARVAIEPSFAKTVQSTLTSMADCHARLPDVVTLYRLEDADETKEINGREHRKREAVAYEFAARAEFEQTLAHTEQ